MAKRQRGFTQTKSGSAKKRHRASGGRTRKGFSSTARTRGAAVTGEMKYFDTALGVTAIASSAGWTGTEIDPTTFNTLCVPVVGAGIDQRIGKSINVHKIKVRGTVVVPLKAAQSTADAPSQIRLCLYQDMQTNATQSQGEDFMTAAATAAVAVNTFQNINNFGRFRSLKDQTMILQDPNMAGEVAAANIIQQGILKTFKWTVNFKEPVKVRFNATNGGTVADIVDNSFHIIANASAIDLPPGITYVCRVGYKE